MFEAHDALMCIGEKTYVNDSNRTKLTNQHYFKSSDEMIELFNTSKKLYVAEYQDG